MSTATMETESGPVDCGAAAPVADSKEGPLAEAFGLLIGKTEKSAHFEINQMRRHLPILVRVAREEGQIEWLHRFLVQFEIERRKCEVRPLAELLRPCGSADRSEDGAREAYILHPCDETAMELESRLTHQLMKTIELIHSLRAEHLVLTIQ